MSNYVKTGFAVVIGLLLIAVLFWQFLISTAGWVAAKQVTSNIPATYTTLETIAAITATSSATTTEFNTLLLPKPFENTTVRNQTAQILVIKDVDSQAFYLAAPMPTFAQTLTNNSAYSETERLSACANMQAVFERDPCNSNLDFVHVLFTTARTAANIFSSTHKKQAATTFLILREFYLPNDTKMLQQADTPYGTVYLARSGEKAQVFLFANDGTEYELTFVKMTEEEMFEVLQAITLQSD